MTEEQFRCSNQECSIFNSKLGFKEAQKTDFKCPFCESPLESILATEKTVIPDFSIPDSIDPEKLPTCLALSVLPLFKEPHPFVRLWRLVDTAEIALRWSVAIAIAEVIKIHHDELPVELALDIKDQLALPTMGKWLSILKTVTKDIPNEPLIATGIFNLYEDCINKLFAENGNEDNSLLELRNNLAHSSGGMSKERAEEIYKGQLPNLIDLLAEVAKLTTHSQIIHKKGSVEVTLVGSSPQELKSDVISEDRDETYLIKGDNKLSLLPLVNYGTIKIIDQNGRQHVIRDDGYFIQVYANNRKRNEIKYSPIGSDYAYSTIKKDKLFKDLFEPEIKSNKNVQKSFIEEANEIVVSQLMKGRGDDVKLVKNWIKGEDKKRNFENPQEPRIGWIEGKPGMGKSMLAATIANHLNTHENICLFYYKFKVGDFRNNKRMFLESLQSTLMNWEPLIDVIPNTNNSKLEDDELIENIKVGLNAVQNLKSQKYKHGSNERIVTPYLLCVIDGLDEIVRDDKSILPLIKEFAPLRVLWVIASRNEYNLNTYFDDDNCEKIFPDGLPPLNEKAIGEILSDQMEGASKYKFVGADADKKEKLLKRLVEKSEGLPLYIHHLIDDLGSGNTDESGSDYIDIDDFCDGNLSKLPNGLNEYYHRYLDRIGISDAKSDLTKILCLLCISEEPIDEYGLGILLANGTPRAEEYIQRVKKALEIGDALIKISPTPETSRAWTIFHQSFRDYVLGVESKNNDEAQPPAEELVGSVNDAKYALSSLSFLWQSLNNPQAEPIRNHLFRHGTHYSLLTENKELIDDVKSKLTNFSYLQARTKYLPAAEITNLVQEYKAVLKSLPEEDSDFRIWETFFRQKAHILRRGDDPVWKTKCELKDRILDHRLPFKLTENGWKAYKILLQLAIEHAENSPITKAAEVWLESGACDWLWIRKKNRPLKVLKDLSLKTFENELIDSGFDASVYLVNKNKIFIHSRTGFMLFSTSTGDCLSAEYSKHVKSIKIDDNFLASWHGNSIIKIWSLSTGKIYKTLVGHNGVIKGVLNLGGSKIISWDENEEIKIWCVETGDCIDSLIGDFSKYNKIYQLKDSNKIIGIKNNRKLQSYKLKMHSIDTSPISIIELIGHDETISGVKQLNGNEIISWSSDNICKIWEVETGKCIKTITRLTGDKEKILLVDESKIISSFKNYQDSRFSIRILSFDNEKVNTVLNIHDFEISEVFNVNNDSYISYDIKGNTKMWSLKKDKSVFNFPQKYNFLFIKPIQINGKYLILCDMHSTTLDIWSLETGLLVNRLTGHLDVITEIQKLDQDKVVSFSNYKCKLWQIESSIMSTKENGLDINKYVITSIVNNGVLIILESNLLIRLVCTKTGKTIKEDKRFVQSNVSEKDHIDIYGRINKNFKFINLDSGQVLFIANSNKIYSVPIRDNEKAVTFKGHFDRVVNVLQMDKNSILSYCASGVFILWDICKQKIISSIQIMNKSGISKAVKINSHMFLTWGIMGNDIKVWSIYKNEPINIFSEHDSSIEGAMLLANNLILSWDILGEFKIWSHHLFKSIESIKLKLYTFIYVDELTDNLILVRTHSFKSEFKTILLDSNTLKIFDADKFLKSNGKLVNKDYLLDQDYDYLGTFKSSVFVEFVNHEGVVWHGEGSDYEAISFSSTGNYFIENNGCIEHLQLYKGKYPISSEDIQAIQEK